MWKRVISNAIVLLSACCAVALSSSCDQPEGPHQTKPERPKVLLLLNVNTNEFFRKIEEGFRQGMSPAMQQEYQLDVHYSLKPSDIGYQRLVLDHYLTAFVKGGSGPSLKAVVMSPAGSGDEVTREIKELRDNKIPVVLVDLQIKPDALQRAQTDYNAFIGSRNRDGAVLAADEMARCLPEGGSILVLDGPPGMEVAKERRVGFTERLTEIGKQGQIPFKITEKTADFLRSQARTTVDALITGGQSFEGIFAANDEMALGALEALQYKDARNKVVVIGFDAIQEAVKAINDERMAASIAQDPLGIGQRAARTVEKLLQNQPVEKEQLLPPKLVTH